MFDDKSVHLFTLSCASVLLEMHLFLICRVMLQLNIPKDNCYQDETNSPVEDEETIAFCIFTFQ